MKPHIILLYTVISIIVVKYTILKDNLNFLYCFDENYNFQALTSMISLLDSVDEEINIYVIHTFKK